MIHKIPKWVSMMNAGSVPSVKQRKPKTAPKPKPMPVSVKPLPKGSKIKTTKQKLTSAFRAYARIAWLITEQQPWRELPNAERRGWRDYHLDHIKPLFRCWQQGISPGIAGHISNLQMLPYQENMIKGRGKKPVYSNPLS